MSKYREIRVNGRPHDFAAIFVSPEEAEAGQRAWEAERSDVAVRIECLRAALRAVMVGTSEENTAYYCERILAEDAAAADT